MKRLILVRHGEPLGHEGRCVGQWDCPLSDAGGSQIRALACAARESIEALSPSIVTSDLARARESARIITDIWSLDAAKIRVDRMLRESHFGDWDGRTWQEITEDDPVRSAEWGASWTTVAPPNGESLPVFTARVGASLDALLRSPDECICVVGHAGWIRVATALLLGERVEAVFERPLAYAQASMIEVSDAFVRQRPFPSASP